MQDRKKSNFSNFVRKKVFSNLIQNCNFKVVCTEYYFLVETALHVHILPYKKQNATLKLHFLQMLASQNISVAGKANP